MKAFAGSAGQKLLHFPWKFREVCFLEVCGRDSLRSWWFTNYKPLEYNMFKYLLCFQDVPLWFLLTNFIKYLMLLVILFFLPFLNHLFKRKVAWNEVDTDITTWFGGSDRLRLIKYAFILNLFTGFYQSLGGLLLLLQPPNLTETFSAEQTVMCVRFDSHRKNADDLENYLFRCRIFMATRRKSKSSWLL